MASRRWRRTGLNTVHQVRIVIEAVTTLKEKVNSFIYATNNYTLKSSNFHLNLIPKSYCLILLLSADSTVQPKFYCLLSPEASEDDISRLDTKVNTIVGIYLCFNIVSTPKLHNTLTTFSLAGVSKTSQWIGQVWWSLCMVDLAPCGRLWVWHCQKTRKQANLSYGESEQQCLISDFNVWRDCFCLEAVFLATKVPLASALDTE